MWGLLFSAICMLAMIFCLFYCIYILLKKDWEKNNMAIPIISLIVAILAFIFMVGTSIDFSDLVTLDNSKYVFLNSTVYAYSNPFVTIRYTLDGSSPYKNGILYTDEGIHIKKEDVKDDSFVVSYQIGISNLLYFSKVYTKEYTVSSAVELYPKIISDSDYIIMEGAKDIDSKVIIFHNSTIDENESGECIIDGDSSTKKEFTPSINHSHTIVFSEPNNTDFSKLYICQQGIRQIKITIDDTYNYFCKFDPNANINSCNLFEIDFAEDIPIQSTIKLEVYSSENYYSINDIWFDYYITANNSMND